EIERVAKIGGRLNLDERAILAGGRFAQRSEILLEMLLDIVQELRRNILSRKPLIKDSDAFLVMADLIVDSRPCSDDWLRMEMVDERRHEEGPQRAACVVRGRDDEVPAALPHLVQRDRLTDELPQASIPVDAEEPASRENVQRCLKAWASDPGAQHCARCDLE